MALTFYTACVIKTYVGTIPPKLKDSKLRYHMTFYHHITNYQEKYEYAPKLHKNR